MQQGKNPFSNEWHYFIRNCLLCFSSLLGGDRMYEVCDVLDLLSDLLFMSRDDAWYWTEPATDLQHCSFSIFDGTTTVRSSLSRLVLMERLPRFRRAQRQRISPSPEPQFITTLHPLSPLDPPYPLSSPPNTSGKSRLSANSTVDPSKMTHQQFESPTLVDQQTHHPPDSVRRRRSISSFDPRLHYSSSSRAMLFPNKMLTILRMFFSRRRLSPRLISILPNGGNKQPSLKFKANLTKLNVSINPLIRVSNRTSRSSFVSPLCLEFSMTRPHRQRPPMRHSTNAFGLYKKRRKNWRRKSAVIKPIFFEFKPVTFLISIPRRRIFWITLKIESRMERVDIARRMMSHRHQFKKHHQHRQPWQWPRLIPTRTIRRRNQRVIQRTTSRRTWMRTIRWK